MTGRFSSGRRGRTRRLARPRECRWATLSRSAGRWRSRTTSRTSASESNRGGVVKWGSAEKTTVPHRTTPRLHHSTTALRNRGFTLIEMLTVVAGLIIVLGLMVSLAWDVRRQSSERLTKDLLVKLDVLMAQYIAHHKQLPQVTPLVETRGGVRVAARSAAATQAVRSATRPAEEELPDEE